MADDTEQYDDGDLEYDDGYGENGKSSGGKKKLLLIVLPLLLLGGIGAGLYFSGIIGGEEGAQMAETEEAAPPPPKQTEFYDLPPMLVNLNSTGPRPLYLKLQPSLEIGTDVQRVEIERLGPRIRDKFQVYLRELRLEDLRGSAGIDRLRQVLLAEIREAVHPIEIENILFKELLIQ